jgi:hypothetical protein
MFMTSPMRSYNKPEILLCCEIFDNNIFHYNNSFLQEFIDKNFQL